VAGEVDIWAQCSLHSELKQIKFHHNSSEDETELILS